MECFNCTSLLDEKNYLYLPKCGHPFCHNCLIAQTQIEDQMTCQVCFIQISDPVPMMTESSIIQQNCAVCQESHLASKFCIDCDEAFCDAIADSHSFNRIFLEHSLISIEEYHESQKAHHHLNCLHPKSCIQHNRPFEFLNMGTKTRNELLCSECLTGNHTALVRLGNCTSSLLKEKLENIAKLWVDGSVRLSELGEKEESLSSRLKCLEESKNCSLSEIRRVFESLHEALATRQLELEREVEELTKSTEFKLSEERERSRERQGQLSLMGKCVEEINPKPLPSPSLSSSSSLSTSSPSPSPPVPSPKALMVDACLLEDALRSSLSSFSSFPSSPSSHSGVESQLRVSEIPDQIHFSFHLLSTPPSSCSSSTTSPSSLSHGLKGEDKLEAILHLISSMCSVTSTSTPSSSSPLSPSLVPPSDWSKNKVQSVMTFYSQGKGANQFSDPCGMTYSPDSKLFYVCDSGINRIQVFRNHTQAEREGRVEIEFLPHLGGVGSCSVSSSSTSSSSSGVALSPPYTAPPSLSHPTDICYHDGQLFITDQYNHRVQVWREEDGSFLRMIGTGYGKGVGQFALPCGCTVYQNHLFVSEYRNHRIQKFSLSDFSVVKVIGSEGSGLGQLIDPRELSVFNGKLYVIDYCNHRISVFDPESGAALSVIGPSLPRDGNLSCPLGILSSHNLLFVSSARRISVFDSDHNYLYSFGSSGTGDVQFNHPIGMVMVNEKMFIIDHRIHVMEQRRELGNIHKWFAKMFHYGAFAFVFFFFFGAMLFGFLITYFKKSE